MLPLILAALAGPPTDTKAVLLLDDLSVVEAEPGKDGGYTVKRNGVAEAIPAGRVRFAGDSRAAVHQYLLAQAANRPAAPAGYGFHPQAVPAFAAQVQPILANRCAACHARPDHASGFKLAPVTPGYADPEGVARNARAAGLQVNRLDPARSPLLALAGTPHGGGGVPLPKHSPAYAGLERWVYLAAMPQPGERREQAKPTAPLPPSPRPPAVGGTARPAAGDPTDPGPFNRTQHPGRG
jgi:hypothetical protein